MSALVKDCPFCRGNWKNLKLLAQSSGGSIAVIEPLHPVTAGHVLIVHANHTENVADKPGYASSLMEYAAKYVRDEKIDANIITSVGKPAGAAIDHTHLHVIPRAEGDGITLPWTDQGPKRGAATPDAPGGWGEPNGTPAAIAPGGGWGEAPAPPAVTRPSSWAGR